MSALLSMLKYGFVSSAYSQYQALQVGGFRHRQQDGMVLGLGPVLQNTKISVHITGGLGDHFHEIGRTDMVGTGTCNEYPAGAKHFHSPQIQLFVAPEGSL